MRSRLPVRQSRNRTHQAFAIVSDTLCLCIENHQQSVSLTHGGGNTLFQPFIILIFYDQFVNDYFNIMILITIQFQTMCNLTNLPVDTDIQVSFFPDLFKEFFIMSLTRTHQRGQHIDFLPFIIFQNKFQYLFFGVFHHLFSRKIRISYSGTGIKQTEIVVNLCSGSDRRTGIFVRSFLFNGNNRTQSCYLIYIRTLQIAQKVAGISRKSFNIAALSFCKYRIESKR